MLSSSSRETVYFVTNIVRSLSEEAVANYFSFFHSAYFILERDKEGRSLGYGWVLCQSSFPNLEDRNPHNIDGKLVLVNQCVNTMHESIKEKMSLLKKKSIQHDSNSSLNNNGLVPILEDCKSSCEKSCLHSPTKSTLIKALSEYYFCIPVSLCSADLASDHKVFIAKRDNLSSDLKVILSSVSSVD